MYVYYNPNPYGRFVGDCVVRAVSKVTGQSWDETYIGAVVFGYEIKNMPSAASSGTFEYWTDDSGTV